jgi:hypothetical protein
LLVAAEYGIYFTINGGTNWHKLAGAPTIAFRDLKLQRRDNDLVGATFGRGVYILDDYSALRSMAADGFGNGATLFPVRDAWWYIPSAPSQAVGMPTLGSDSFTTPNPEFGATFTYYLDKDLENSKLERKSREDSLREDGKNIPFPGWERLGEEALETEPRVLILVSDSLDNPVRWIEASAEKGTHRFSWDLRYPAPDAIDLSTPEFVPPWAGASKGPLASPGSYSAQLYALSGHLAQPLAEAQSFNVKPVQAASDGIDYAEVAAYQQASSALIRKVVGANEELKRTQDLLKHMKAAAVNAPAAAPSLFTRLDAFGAELGKLETRLTGDRVRKRLSETSIPSIYGRAYNAANNWDTTRPATATQKADFEIATSEFAIFEDDLEALLTGQLAQLEADLKASGAPSWR